MNFRFVSRTPTGCVAMPEFIIPAVSTKLVFTLSFEKLPANVLRDIQIAMENKYTKSESSPSAMLWMTLAQHYKFPLVAVGKQRHILVSRGHFSAGLEELLMGMNKLSANKRMTTIKEPRAVLIGGLRVDRIPRPDGISSEAVARLVWDNVTMEAAEYGAAFSRLFADMQRGQVTIVGV